MGNTKSGYTKQPTQQVNNEPPPAYEEHTIPVKIPELINQPIKLKDLKREAQEFAAEQTKAYEDNYVKICDHIIEHINDHLRNRNDSRVSITLTAKGTFKYIPTKFLSAKLTKLYLQNYKRFVCEMYKDFNIETLEQIGCIRFIFHIPE